MDESTPGETTEERRRRRAREAQARFRARERGEDVPFLIRTGRRKPLPGFKICRDCGEEKTADEFYLVRHASKPARLHSYCKPCCVIRGKSHRDANPDANRDRLKARYWADVEATRAAARAYRLANPERARERDRARRETVRVRKLLTQYGLTVGQYEELAQRQGGVCAICKKPDAQGTQLAVDHCHDTGAVRGLLCLRCNSGIGLFYDDLALVRSAMRYLEAPPASG